MRNSRGRLQVSQRNCASINPWIAFKEQGDGLTTNNNIRQNGAYSDIATRSTGS